MKYGIIIKTTKFLHLHFCIHVHRKCNVRNLKLSAYLLALFSKEKDNYLPRQSSNIMQVSRDCKKTSYLSAKISKW